MGVYVRQAIIKDGIVTNIIIGSMGGIDLPDDSQVSIGWTYDGTFSPPIKTAEQLAVEVKIAESNLAKADVVANYIENHTIAEIAAYVKADVNAEGVTNLATAVTALQKIETLIIKLAILHKIK
jgi:hypothetical protein